MVTTAMCSPVVRAAPADVPVLRGRADRERAPVVFSCCPAGAGGPDAHARPDPALRTGTEDRRPRATGDGGDSPSRSACVRSQPAVDCSAQRSRRPPSPANRRAGPRPSTGLARAPVVHRPGHALRERPVHPGTLGPVMTPPRPRSWCSRLLRARGPAPAGPRPRRRRPDRRGVAAAADAEVVAGFDPPDTPGAPATAGSTSPARPGRPVRAALPGTVAFAGRLAGRGVVVVDHGDTRTTYEPVVGHGRRSGTPVAARRGHRQPRRSRAATASRAPACTGAGSRGEAYLDPLDLVGGGRCGCCPVVAGPRCGRSRRPALARRSRRRGRRWRAGRTDAVRSDRSLALSRWAGDRLRRAGGPAGRPRAAGRW